MPLASGVIEAICDFKLEGIEALGDEDTGRGCGLLGGAGRAGAKAGEGLNGSVCAGSTGTVVIPGAEAAPAAGRTVMVVV